jgi:hypothetical protein
MSYQFKQSTMGFLLALLWLVAGISCSSLNALKPSGFKKATDVAVASELVSPVLMYKATSGLASNKMPTKVFLFPPLRSDAKGNPVEALKPVQDSDGNIIDWRTSGSSTPQALQQIIATELRQQGYQVVDFKTVVSIRVPYSILVVSSFYTPETIVVDPPKGLDRSQTVMIKGSVFGVDLDPRGKIDLLKVDGLLNYSAANKPARTLDRAFQESLRWFGDNVEGFIIVR